MRGMISLLRHSKTYANRQMLAAGANLSRLASSSDRSSSGPDTGPMADLHEIISRIGAHNAQQLDMTVLHDLVMKRMADRTSLTNDEAAAAEWMAKSQGFNSARDMAEALARLDDKSGGDVDTFLFAIALIPLMAWESLSDSKPYPPPWRGRKGESSQPSVVSSSSSTMSSTGKAQRKDGPGARRGARRKPESHNAEPKPSDVTLYPSVKGLPPNDEVDAKHAEHTAISLVAPTTFINTSAVQSPIAPISADSSLDDLSPVSLQQLYSTGGMFAASYMCITIVGVALMFACPRAVAEDDEGRRIAIAVYGSSAKDDKDARALLPLGARFALKHPFLKRQADNWLALRVDIPQTLIRLDLLPLVPGQRVLVLGDGDFSFSAALARSNARLSNQGIIIATSLDSQRETLAKYAKAKASLASLALHQNVTVLHNVDATALHHESTGLSEFHTVVWNFPYPPSVRGASSLEGASLIHGFFSSIRTVMQQIGRPSKGTFQIWITLARGQGGSSKEIEGRKKNWDLECVALPHGFSLKDVVPFDTARYEGYEPRREYEDSSFPYQDARIYVFEPVETPSGYDTKQGPSKHSMSYLSNLIHEQWLNKKQQLHLRPLPRAFNKADLVAHPESLVARALLEAFVFFEDALFESLKEGPDCSRVVILFRKAVSIHDGHLVVGWRSHIEREKFLQCCVQALKINAATNDRELKVSAILAFSLIRPDEDANIDLLNDVCEGELKDPQLLLLRAQLNFFAFNRLDEKGDHAGSRVCIESVISDCSFALEHDPRNLTALYTRASALRNHPDKRWMEALSAYEEFVSLADKDDRFLPAALYNVGFCALVATSTSTRMVISSATRDVKKAQKALQEGISAEKRRLTFFGLKGQQSKQLLLMMLANVKTEA